MAKLKIRKFKFRLATRQFITGAGRGINPKVTMEDLEKEEGTESVAITPQELADFCVECATEKMAKNPVVIPMTAVSSIADYFVVASAESEPQLRAMAQAVERGVREKFKLHPLREPATAESGWALIDFGTVIVHLMSEEARGKYNLEGLWNEAAKRR